MAYIEGLTGDRYAEDDDLERCTRVFTSLRKSTRSGDNGQCVEARYADGTAQVRDSKDPAGPVLAFTADRWTAFVESVKADEFTAS